ncbi:pentatricopeptide repeat-containing protein [Trifolium repens]|nr:pentatricopeptide repeat-containing protein [Trifolium repens]
MKENQQDRMVATHFAKENNETQIDQTLFYIETLNAYSILCKILAKIGATDWNTKQADVLSRISKKKWKFLGRKNIRSSA